MNRHEMDRFAGGAAAIEIERGGSRQWLLFAGLGSETTGSLVATFRDESQARRAFVNERLRSLSPGAWARLEAVDSTGRVDVLCWFGPTTRIASSERGLLDEGAPPTPLEEGRLRKEQKTTRRKRWWSWWTSAIVAATLSAVIGTACLVQTGGPASFPRPPGVSGLPVGFEAIREETKTYAPDTSQSWDTRDGLHQGTVVTGALSVEEGHDHRRVYRAGDRYLAGWAPYTVFNDGTEPVTVTVTFLRPVTTGHQPVT